MLFFGTVKAFERFHADINLLTGFLLQSADPGFCRLTLGFVQPVHRQGVGKAPVNELTAFVKGIHPGEKNVKKGFRLIPGMEVQAEIKVGSRRIIEFIIYPLIKALDETAREP